MSKKLIERLKNEGDGVMSRREKLQIADRIEELEDKVDSLEREIDAYESWKDIIKQRDALQADNAQLREAIDRQPYTMDREVCEALAATHKQSLARYHNEVLEKAAKKCEPTIWAEVIRAMKEPE